MPPQLLPETNPTRRMEITARGVLLFVVVLGSVFHFGYRAGIHWEKKIEVVLNSGPRTGGRLVARSEVSGNTPQARKRFCVSQAFKGFPCDPDNLPDPEPEPRDDHGDPVAFTELIESLIN